MFMSYGNSTQKGPLPYGDQLELFSKKKMRNCPFYREDVEAHVKKRLILENGEFMDEGVPVN